MKKIPLTQSKFAIVDDCDFNWLNQWNWYCEHGYAVRTDYTSGKPVKVYMHRLINQTPDGFHTDHINHNRLDNRRKNLRTCTMSQNKANGVRQYNNTSSVKGVTWHKQAGKWRVRIQYQSKRISLGLYDNLDDALRAYRDKARELFGEFAFPDAGA